MFPSHFAEGNLNMAPHGGGHDHPPDYDEMSKSIDDDEGWTKVDIALILLICVVVIVGFLFG